MKLYITGSVGSGKSTLANRISKTTNIPCVHLDDIMHIPCPSSSQWGNVKRSDKEIDTLFYSVINQNNYIIEDTGRERFVDGMKNADRIVVLDIPLKTRKYRILKRWIRQKFRLEKCIYKSDLHMLKSMLRWLKNYESGKDGTKQRIKQFDNKVIYLTNKNEIENFCQNCRKLGI